MWRFWKRGAKRLPKKIQKHLSTEFNLSPGEIADLYCRRQRGHFAGRRVVLLQIFEQTVPGRIIFEGYIEGDFVYLVAKED